ncbi:MAG TPA: hypothetical protein VGC93_03420 [Thermoanaerobaculia bacterium]
MTYDRTLAGVLAALVTAALALPAAAAAAPAKIGVKTSAELSAAIRNVADGGVIELSGGTYPSPAGGFSITNLRKAFTIQAAPNAAVFLDGQGQRPVLRFKNGDRSRGKRVTFRRLTFRNGRAAPGKTDAGGVTVEAAEASFVRCVFTGNTTSGVSVGGGALRLARNAHVSLVQSTFQGNGSTRRGGAVEALDSTLAATGGRFVANRSNLPGHSANAAGGAVYLLNSTAGFTDVLFSGNEAAWVGGALYAFGTWTQPFATPRTAVRLERTSFYANHARPAPGQSAISDTQGGAIHAEDQVTVTALDSAFADNSAAVGAAVNLYRSVLDATGSIFRNHRAGAGDGFGGAIAALSADQADASTGNGSINRPNARVVLRDVLLQGPLDAGLAGALSGGCLLAGGDGARVTGAGVPAQGGLGANRAGVLLEGVVFSGCSTTRRGNTAASGGALRGDLVELEMRDGLVLGSSARGTDGAGGGLSLVGASLATLSGVTFAGNSAGSSGGAVQVRGATLDADGSRFLGNSAGLGAAIFAIPSNRDPVAGTVQRSLFAGQAGIPLRDVGPPSLPANCLRYNANRFSAGASEDVYVHNTAAPAGLNVPGLNGLVVGSCDKSTAPNVRETQPPREGVLAAIQAAGSSGQRLGPYLAFAWTGTAATLDGAPLGVRFGLVQTGPGVHRLAVTGGSSAAVVVDP